MKIDYVEFSAVDLVAIRVFYGEAFGWEFEDWGPDYTAFSNSGLEGGFRRVDTQAHPGGALVILFSDDLDAAEKAVVDAGGTVTELHEFPGGRRFHFADPSGNELAVWTKT